MRPGTIGGGLVLGSALIIALAAPASIVASTGPGPSAPLCTLETSTVVAGTPFELSGSTWTEEAVGVMARRDNGDFKEASVATHAGEWRAVLQFGLADAGAWTIGISVDGAACGSPLTVVLPAGVTAPPSAAPVQDGVTDPVSAGVDDGTIQGAVWVLAIGLVIGSWVLLALLAVVHAMGARPLTRRPVRWIARGAAFIGVLGAFMAVGLFIYIADSIRHFGTGMPPQEQTLLDAGLAGLAVAGILVGALAARRLGRGSDGAVS